MIRIHFCGEERAGDERILFSAASSGCCAGFVITSSGVLQPNATMTSQRTELASNRGQLLLCTVFLKHVLYSSKYFSFLTFSQKHLDFLFVSHPRRSTNADHITLTQDESIQQDFIYWWRCVAKRSRAAVKDTQPFAWRGVGRLKGNQGDVAAGHEHTGCDVVVWATRWNHWVQRLNSWQFFFDVELHYFWWACFWITSLPKATNVCPLSNDCSRAC